MTSFKLLLLAGVTAVSGAERPTPYTEWRAAAGGPEGIRYSSLRQIDRTNVARLQVAWRFDSRDEYKDSEMQCNPIIVDGVLYATTPRLRVIALDAATGKLLWDFDARRGEKVKGRQRNRALTYWSSGSERRLFLGIEHYLYSIDVATGKPAASFGLNGRIDLRDGLGRDGERLTVRANSPGAIYKDLLILGGLTSEELPAAPGHIRAFDVRTGKIRWMFHTIPQPGEFGVETWPEGAWRWAGGANSWPGMALDEQRGIVFVPTGSAAFDFYGANRPGDNLFANSLLALNAATGERVWHYQVVRHDVWDRDLPSPPSLVRVRREGKLVDAVAQITKSGHVWVFHRETGEPLFPVEEREVPPSNVEGEVLARRQRLPLKPAPFARQELTEDMLTRRTPQARRAVVERFRKLRNGPQFTPPSFEGTVIFPGYDGGGEWGGAAWDPETGLLYVNSNEMAWILRITPLPEKKTAEETGQSLYMRNCASCHRRDLKGTPPEFPSLVGIERRRTREQLLNVMHTGAGRMPGFAHLGERAIDAILRWLLRGEIVRAEARNAARHPPLKFGTDGYNKFLDPDGYPAVAPPWGTLNAIDLHTGEYAWKIPFGEHPELRDPSTGSENYGGPLVTAGGLLFIGATNHDRKFRAFDKAAGKLLWQTTLPASGNATPATYSIAGKQYVVIAAGGGKSERAPSGGSYVAFALP